jgi:hypothetical protein
MRRFIFLFIVLSTLVFSQSVKAQQPAPYLYYYSNKDNAFVIERADGTDQQLFAKDETPRQKNPLGIEGPGWSPDGKWFAWITTYTAEGVVFRNGHIIGGNSHKNLDVFKLYKNVYQMDWSPDSKYLLLDLNPTYCKSQMMDCKTDTYWLVDVEQAVTVAVFDIYRERVNVGIEWSTPDNSVSLYIGEEVFTQRANLGYYRVTMHDDGRVEKQPISHDEWKAKAPPIDSSSTTDTKYFPSPSGKYTIALSQTKANVLQNLSDNTSIKIPRSQFGSSHPMTPINAVWSADEEWVMAGYADFNGVYGIGVFKTDGTGYRELATCGPSLSCAGWLPENVDVSHIAVAS